MYIHLDKFPPNNLEAKTRNIHMHSYGVWHNFQQYFSYLVVLTFIGGGNRSTRRKPPTFRKWLIKPYHILLYRVHLTLAGFELTTLVVIGTECTDSCKSNYHTITTTMVPSKCRGYYILFYIIDICDNIINQQRKKYVSVSISHIEHRPK